MNKEKKLTTERILNHALKIIFLLTGEDYMVIRSKEEHVRDSFRKKPRSHVESPPGSGEREDGRMLRTEKIVEHASKIIHLMTGEVFLKEWEFLEGHKEVHKYMMMEKNGTITALDIKKLSDNKKENQPHVRDPQGVKNDIYEDTNAECERRIQVKEEFHNAKELLNNNLMTIKKNTLDKTTNSLRKSGKKLVSDKQSLACDHFSDRTAQPQCKSDLNIIIDNETERKNNNIDEDQINNQENVLNNCGDIGQPNIGIDQTDLLCAISGQIIASRSHFVIRQKTRTKERAHVCGDCGKIFTRTLHLTIHQRTHTGERPYECSDCGKCFTSSSHLVSHKKKHTGERPFVCTDCGKCYTRRSNLVSHQRTHTGERPYMCTECGKSFTHRSHYVDHQKLHTGEGTHICSDCGKSFTRSLHLAIHQRSHTGERPFVCSECGKSFVCSSHLVTHQIIHTGEKPFACPQCGKRFSYRSNLVNHEKKHAG